jgi:hypothetical protein
LIRPSDGKPEVIDWSLELVTTNAPAVSDQSLERSRLPRTYPHDAQMDYFRIADNSAVNDWSPLLQASFQATSAGHSLVCDIAFIRHAP